MSIGAFCNFGTESTGFSQVFPNLKPHLTTLAGNFKVPLYRDYLLAAGKSVGVINIHQVLRVKVDLRWQNGFEYSHVPIE